MLFGFFVDSGSPVRNNARHKRTKMPGLIGVTGSGFGAGAGLSPICTDSIPTAGAVFGAMTTLLAWFFF